MYVLRTYLREKTNLLAPDFRTQRVAIPRKLAASRVFASCRLIMTDL